MVSKKKQKKKEKHHLEVSVPELLSMEQRYLTEGKYRNLLEVTKQLTKKNVQGAAERLQSYNLLRALELYDRNLSLEGLMMLDNISKPLGEIARESQYNKIIDLFLQNDKPIKALNFINSLHGKNSGEKSSTHELLDQLMADYMILDANFAKALPDSFLFHKDMKSIFNGMHKLESGDDTGMEEVLRGVPFRSPFKFWKLLLKGISLFYQYKDEESEKCFSLIPSVSAAFIPACVFLKILNKDKGLSHDSKVKIETENLANCIISHMDPENAKFDLSVKQILNLMADKKFSVAFETAEKVIKSMAGMQEKQIRELGFFFWNTLVISDKNVTSNLGGKYPHLYRYFPDSIDLHRLYALRAEKKGCLNDAVANWIEFAEYLQNEKPVWFNENWRNNATALVLVRAVQNIKKILLLDENFYKKDIEFLEKKLEEAASLYPEYRPIYDEAVDIFKDILPNKPKLGKWYGRLRKAFPDDVNAHIESIYADIDSGQISRAKREILRLIDRTDLAREHCLKIYECMIALSWKMFANNNFEDSREILTILLEKNEENRNFIMLKLGCMEYAKGLEKRGKPLIDEAMSKIMPAELGLLMASVEMKRFRANPIHSKTYQRQLRDTLKKNKTISPAPLAEFHMQCLKSQPYPNSQEESDIIIEALKNFSNQKISEADLIVIIEYLEHIGSFHGLLKTYIKKAVSVCPGNFRFRFLKFFHIECSCHPRELSAQQIKQLEQWAEFLRQQGDFLFSDRIYHFLNRCRHIVSEHDYYDEDEGEYLDFSPKMEGDDMDFFAAMEADPRAMEDLSMLMEILHKLPDTSDPSFEKTAKKVLTQYGLGGAPKEIIKLIKEMKNAAKENGLDDDDFFNPFPVKGPSGKNKIPTGRPQQINKHREQKTDYEQLELELF